MQLQMKLNSYKDAILINIKSPRFDTARKELDIPIDDVIIK